MHAHFTNKPHTEIRNRIYDFCKEKSGRYSNQPPPLRKIKIRQVLPEFLLRARTFFSLTQACKQIRLEYRPLWLRQSRVLVDIDDLEEFLSTFYRIPDHPETWYRDAPRALTISWDHDMSEYGDDVALIDIGPLLKLHAYAPSSIITFQSRRLLEFALPCAKCNDCGYCIHADDYAELECDDPADEMRYEEMGYPCNHEDTIDDVIESLHSEYGYLSPLNEFLGNSNTRWLKTVQDMPLNSIELACTMGEHSYVPTIYIRFEKQSAPAQLRTRDTYRRAVTYLTEMGMTDLAWYEHLDFVVGVQTNKWNRHLHGCIYPVYDQTLVHGEDLKAPSTRTEAGTQTLDSVTQN